MWGYTRSDSVDEGDIDGIGGGHRTEVHKRKRGAASVEELALDQSYFPTPTDPTTR